VKIVPFYIADGGVFQYLLMSLETWKYLDYHKFVDKFWIFVNPDRPLSEIQLSDLMELGIPVEIVISQHGKVKRNGMALIKNEYFAFKMLSELSDTSDWIQKIDVDMLVLNLDFVRFLGGDAEYVGESVSWRDFIADIPNSYFEGGTYFTRARVWKDLVLDVDLIYSLDTKMRSEDAFFGYVMNKNRVEKKDCSRKMTRIFNHSEFHEEYPKCFDDVSFLHFSGGSRSRMRLAFNLIKILKDYLRHPLEQATTNEL